CNDFFPDTNTNIPSRTVYVFPSAPVSLNSNDSICPNEEVVFTATADTLYKSFFWQFGDGDTLVTLRPDTIARHTYKSSGSYNLMLVPRTPSSQLCIDTVFKTIFVTQIKADFDVDASGAPVYRFINKSSSNAVRYLWNFDDVNSGAANTTSFKDASHQFSVSQLDTFWVCLWAFNAEDCEDSICKPVVLGARVKIPNVFTPDNADNMNDAFDIDIEGWTKYEIVIFNRWGNKVFEGDKDGLGNDGINWNGKVDNTGAACPAGVYYFIFKYKLVTEPEPKTVTGTVTLIREN
ncbi:MAG: gliding motility-associated C-terminal domain-containing protein, partial [Bacteroidota bacterium]